MFKSVGAVVVILTVAFVLSACEPSSDCFQEDVFCAALVTDTQGIEDHGMNQDIWAGLEQSKAADIVDRVEYIESVDSRDYEKNIAYFGEQGFDVIVTVGAGMDDETLRAADLHPDSPQGTAPVFVGVDQYQSESRANLIPVTFPEDQMGFLAGALAVRLSETQIVGAVCETSGIDSMWRYCEGFRAGVAFVNELEEKNVSALVSYRDDGDREKLFLDETWGHDTAHGLIRRGADVIFAAGGVTGEGALRAAAEAGVKSIGTERDQKAALAGSGPSVVTSILGDASFEVQKILRLIKDGKVAVHQSGQIKYIPFDQTFPENLTREMDTLLLALMNGQIKTNVTLSKP
ncbi:Membrane lipoprotein TmpC [Anaerolineales bacterium]|nr:Membrane lipoprotein TmpC [Anaerolineales bacterium]